MDSWAAVEEWAVATAQMSTCGVDIPTPTQHNVYMTTMTTTKRQQIEDESEVLARIEQAGNGPDRAAVTLEGVCAPGPSPS
jgi:hypothetical protein